MKVTRRVWNTNGRQRVAWGFSAQRGGTQVRRFKEEWSKADAEAALSRWTLGLEAEAAPAPAAGLTFGEMVDKFLAEKQAEGKRSIQDDIERSRRLVGFFGAGAALRSITTRRVAEYRLARLAATSRLGRPMSPTTVNREAGLLRSILRMALAWDELDKLPVVKLAREEPKERFLTVSEIARLLAACGESKNQRLRAIVVVGLHTGLRKGELLGLRWENVDFARGVIALGRNTKSGKGRDVPIDADADAVLAPLRKAAGGVEAAGRVWGEIRDISTAYTWALKRARILDPEVDFHTLRHTFASHYVMRGGSLVKLQAMLGHASVRTTQRYAHLAPDHLIGATAILEGLGGLVVNAPATHGPVGAVRVSAS